MPIPTYTDITMLLDRSGSMAAIRGATIEGFGAFIAEQRKSDDRCTVSLAQFDHEYQIVYTERELAEVGPLELQPRGTTALLDAIGATIVGTGQRLAAMPPDARPGAVLVGIMTDGYENASQEYTRAAIKAMITEQTEVYEWTFLYLGADQNAIEEGATIGIGADHSLSYAGHRSDQALRTMGGNVRAYRGGVAAGRGTAAARRLASFTDEQRSDLED